MSKYLVVKAAEIEGVRYPYGSVVEDPDYADVLISRGFISPVPDNFGTDTAAKTADKPADAEPTYKELQARARELEIPANGSGETLKAAIAAREAEIEAEAAAKADEPSGDADTEEQAPSSAPSGEGPAPDEEGSTVEGTVEPTGADSPEDETKTGDEAADPA